MEGLGVGAGIAIASLLLTIMGTRWKRDDAYIAHLERRLELAEKRAEKAEEEHDKCDEDKEDVKRALESSEREKNNKDRYISELLEELRGKDRQIRKLGGTPE